MLKNHDEDPITENDVNFNSNTKMAFLADINTKGKRLSSHSAEKEALLGQPAPEKSAAQDNIDTVSFDQVLTNTKNIKFLLAGSFKFSLHFRGYAKIF